MKIIRIGEAKIIMSNPQSLHSYFAWPTVARLQNDKIAVVASGFRLKHVCPFGKTVISYSENEGETYTLPAPVIDTVLDDRDGGILPFGKSSVIVTSFNNTVDFQRSIADASPYSLAYLDNVSKEAEMGAHGSTFRISHDFGVTFGRIYKSPVTSPHGPLELPDGTLLWVGRTFSHDDRQMSGKECIEAHKINSDGSTEYVGKIESSITKGDTKLGLYEPHAIVLDDGTILAHIRAHNNGYFTIFQSKSSDGGKTWSTPIQILSDCGGAPPHLFKHSSGTLICTYGYRGVPYDTPPCSIRVMFSRDNGNTWDVDFELYGDNPDPDLGYPSTIELADGSLLTVFYAKNGKNEPAVIMQQKWRFKNEI